MEYYIPWLDYDDVENNNFSWLKHDLKPMRTPANIKQAAKAKITKAISEYNSAAKLFNTARKKLLKAAKTGNREAYAKLKALYKTAKAKQRAALMLIKAHRK